MGSFDLGPVAEQWEKILQLLDLVEAADRRRDDGTLTDRKFDESQAAGHRAYIGAYSQIAAAAEHVDALRALLVHHGATPRAPWTLLRSVFEAGFWATWLLEPDSGLDRRRRGLRLEVRSMKQRAAFYNDFLRHEPMELAQIRDRHAKHEAVYRSEAEALGLAWGRAGDNIQVAAELEKLEVVKQMGSEIQGATVGVWRSLSGMQHGYAYALVMNSVSHEEEQILGGERQLLTISDSHFQTMATSANLMLITAMNLYVARCSRASL